jgi:hypothetical protein
MIDEIKQLTNNPTMQEAYSTEESFKDYSNDALTDMIINSSRFEGNEEGIARVRAELERRKQNKQTTDNKMTKEDLKNYIREALKKRLSENQPAPSRETPERGTETIPDRGTEEEKKRRRIGNPNVDPKPKAMNETEQEMVKRIVARYKSKK